MVESAKALDMHPAVPVPVHASIAGTAERA